MTWQGWLQIAIFATLVTAAVKPLGWYIARIVEGGRHGFAHARPPGARHLPAGRR